MGIWSSFNRYDHNGTTDVFVRDLVANRTALVSANAAGVSANGPSMQPSMNAAGGMVLFTSLASDLVSGDFNQTTDVFLARLGAPLLISTSVAPGELVLTFSTLTGRKYQIEVTGDLGSNTWGQLQQLTGTGGTVPTRIPLESRVPQRFYRIRLLE